MTRVVAIAVVFGALITGCSPDGRGESAAPGTGVPAAGADGDGAGATASPVGGSIPGAPSPSTAGAGGVAGGEAGSGNAGGGAGAAGEPSSTPGTDAGQAGTFGAADAAMPDAGSAAPTLPPAASVDADGVFATSQDLASGPRGNSGLFYPTELGTDGIKHPIFVWGCGGGSQPSSYADHMKRIASHGFVAIAEVSMVGDDDDVLTASLDWLLAENERPESMFHDKLDATRIAVGGHSVGSVNTFLVADDPRVLTTIHVAGGSLDDVNDPFAPTTGLGGKSLVHPAAFICAESDVFGNVEKTEADYAATTAPVFFTVISGADHVGAAREGLPAIVAWLRWHLAGETERRSMFLDPTGEFRTGKYVSQSKNW